MNSKRKHLNIQSQGTGKKKEKREEEVGISDVINEEVVKNRVRETWRRKERYSHAGIEVDANPFPHCIIKDFIQSQSFLEGLQKELLDLNFHQKSNDLYKFKQSADLKKRKDSHISALRKVLFEQFRSWLSEIMQVELENTVDISCAKYEYTDVLLCHDDELEGRRVAFILYLVPPWDRSDGGTLDLYSTDEHCQPQQIVKSLLPSLNTLVFFEVSPVSFHQVSEVTSEGKRRLSVSGWFHGRSLERPPRYMEPAQPRTPHIPRDESLLYEWVNPQYMDLAYQAQVQEEFEESSEILLKDFLKADKFDMVCEALRKSDIVWKRRGPPNKRCYECAEEAALPECVSQCWELLASEAMFLLLSNFTGLKLHYLASGDDDEEDDDDDDDKEEKEEKTDETVAGSSDAAGNSIAGLEEKEAPGKTMGEWSAPVCRGELRRWRRGDYTIVHDTDVGNAEFALDLLLFLGCEDWQTEYGGFTSYIANGEDEELLTIYPENNSLALVYRDRETLKFVKHINHQSLERLRQNPDRQGFYDFSFVYYE
ncbi:prolyl 3-hydroxylase OGFOD1 isoform X2 [Polyodon spathula]|uniref:prolyl 3-hydroxylase OGFOD1 isoform X2 n=1 Tax=Polyodon spathula TaxID=7913 RepID=UPI001B7DBB8B|nr:prolyl 3-hydroxylase OGFOD1 isoform X2 [Polyodon spathula]